VILISTASDAGSARFLVHQQKVDGPATHAIVLGVGAYPHLLGGSGPLSNDHDGMAQLTSPPRSAREFAEWVISTLNDPGKPLSTVALLLAEANPSPFPNPKTNHKVPVELATIDNVERAVSDWKARGDTNPENRLLFFFSGHGIAQGPDTSLLVADYGSKPNNPLDGAISLREFHLGMDTCAAREQCYFIDACRASSDTLIGAMGYAGHPIILPRTTFMREGGPREAPVYYSTLAGEEAYSRPNQVSPFTNALRLALDGLGGDDSEGDWRVSTTRLKEAIDWFMKQAVDPDLGTVQVPVTNNLTTFFLHYLDREPEVPVFVGCLPDAANPEARFSCLAGGDLVQTRTATPGQLRAWELRLPVGNYEFVAEFDQGLYRMARREAYVRPVYRRIRPLEVS
jgi:Caspase domain